ncbi:hypothetical protein PLESTM_000074400, partial [Pleodorina starrii]
VTINYTTGLQNNFELPDVLPYYEPDNYPPPPGSRKPTASPPAPPPVLNFRRRLSADAVPGAIAGIVGASATLPVSLAATSAATAAYDIDREDLHLFDDGDDAAAAPPPPRLTHGSMAHQEFRIQQQQKPYEYQSHHHTHVPHEAPRAAAPIAAAAVIAHSPARSLVPEALPGFPHGTTPPSQQREYGLALDVEDEDAPLFDPSSEPATIGGMWGAAARRRRRQQAAAAAAPRAVAPSPSVSAPSFLHAVLLGAGPAAAADSSLLAAAAAGAAADDLSRAAALALGARIWQHHVLPARERQAAEEAAAAPAPPPPSPPAAAAGASGRSVSYTTPSYYEYEDDDVIDAAAAAAAAEEEWQLMRSAEVLGRVFTRNRDPPRDLPISGELRRAAYDAAAAAYDAAVDADSSSSSSDASRQLTTPTPAPTATAADAAAGGNATAGGDADADADDSDAEPPSRHTVIREALINHLVPGLARISQRLEQVGSDLAAITGGDVGGGAAAAARRRWLQAGSTTDTTLCAGSNNATNIETQCSAAPPSNVETSLAVMASLIMDVYRLST